MFNEEKRERISRNHQGRIQGRGEGGIAYPNPQIYVAMPPNPPPPKLGGQMPPKMLFNVIDKKLLNNMLTNGVDSWNRSQLKKKLIQTIEKKWEKKLMGWYYGYISTDKDSYRNDGECMANAAIRQRRFKIWPTIL